MARKRVCLAGFENGEGPWVIATGEESAAKVSPLKQGEYVGLEMGGQIGALHLRAGVNHIKIEKGKKYRFVKTVDEGIKPSKTCVEVLFNV